MKKLMFLFACLFVLVSTGCKDKEPESLEALTGTSWKAVQEDVDFKDTASLTFQATTFRLVSNITEDGKDSVEEVTGTYTYAGLIVTLTPTLGGDKPMSGVVNNETISFKEGDKVLVFYRQ